MPAYSCRVCGLPSPERYCPDHKPAPRPTARQRGYDAAWDRRRKAFLAKYPKCSLCPAPANVADHFPLSRKQLLARGIRDPDADQFLRSLCHRCHSKETARNQPGGWHAKRLRSK